MKRALLIVLLLFACHIQAQVGIGTTTPLSTLDINGNLSVKVVTLNGGAPFNATQIDDGVYINLIPSSGAQEFILPDPRTYPGRVYILRNIENTQQADIYTQGAAQGVLMFAGDSSTGVGVVNMTTAVGPGNPTKTLIFVSDGANWTYGHLGF
ncbi:MAG: hypothetical protein HKO90_02080 [Flavobacteriaceae bacterium]|nr:hypothetical protein [Bacteroidia bacterium]NNK87048.1 hypothetical protein [Flavobacteriaceae bacterium]